MTLDQIQMLATDWSHVGSRVTCNPAPTLTDDDYLVLAPSAALENEMMDAGWQIMGSRIHNEGQVAITDRFRSYGMGELNVIVTESADFFRRFMAATSVAGRLNLLDKADRVALFQAVLYGNVCGWEPTP